MELVRWVVHFKKLTMWPPTKSNINLILGIHQWHTHSGKSEAERFGYQISEFQRHGQVSLEKQKGFCALWRKSRRISRSSTAKYTAWWLRIETCITIRRNLRLDMANRFWSCKIFNPDWWCLSICNEHINYNKNVLYFLELKKINILYFNCFAFFSCCKKKIILILVYYKSTE